MTTLRDIGEDALIERLVGWVPRDADPAAGPGDDCAVIDLDPEAGVLQLLKTDALVERIHFLSETPGRAVGWKAAARVVSDFAAMGGRPSQFLVTVVLPATTRVAWVEGLYQGIGDCLRRFGGVLAGGETSSVPEGSAAVISIAATGTVLRDQVVLRSSARPGDVVLASGLLGGSISGKHLDFTPRCVEAGWLVANWKPTAMMDLSDGLAKDLPRLAAASGCGFTVQRERLPLTADCSVEQGLGDGEDYELLMTIEPERVDGLLGGWRRQFPDLPLTVIGRMVEEGAGDVLVGGWEHF